MGHRVPLWSGLSWRMEMSRSKINTRGSTGERACWSDRVVDEAQLVPAGIGLGDQKTAARTPKSLWLCVLYSTHGK